MGGGEQLGLLGCLAPMGDEHIASGNCSWAQPRAEPGRMRGGREQSNSGVPGPTRGETLITLCSPSRRSAGPGGRGVCVMAPLVTPMVTMPLGSSLTMYQRYRKRKKTRESIWSVKYYARIWLTPPLVPFPRSCGKLYGRNPPT